MMGQERIPTPKASPRSRREALRARWRWLVRRPIKIQPYHGFGTEQFIYVSGRVLRDRRIVKHRSDGFWRNFHNSFKRFASREVRDAELQVDFFGQAFRTRSDKEGYFILEHPLSPPLTQLTDSDDPWRKAQVSLADQRLVKETVKAQAEVLIPGPRASFGIISDIDDTILKTYVTSWLKWRMLYLTIWKNVFARQAFADVAAFFQALRRGPTGNSYNPFFYVSNSPWNIYDQLEDFLSLNKLPRGPIMLRDLGRPYEQKSTTYHGTKQQRIERVLESYPALPFVLIGDSGESDIDIYRAIFAQYPDRILAIYIRDVRSESRAKRVQNKLDELPIPNLLVKHYSDAARHAAQHGLLDLTTFKTI